ncbi:MAG TPA: hypothetical protein PLZ93_18215 [Nocardioides sp.]|uniref:hypothetical protein n=1 Tax=uncultured Nocardioides sp. TaxID=198441 RepID=UPI000EEA7A71|nr:hypothetical protein [uncultured Nocardioides sp.]HCB04949.1 hypothetical protein [Nocardioides sp.]HRI97560.1 hypothetical protein [Nocardioides sp.]
MTESLRTEPHPAGLWGDRLWPVLAGAVTAAAVVGAVSVYGPLGTVLLSLGLWLLVSLMVWGAFSESGVGGVRAIRYGGIAAHSLMTMVGILILLPVLGWIAVAVWGLTSPLVTGWFGRRRARRRSPATDGPAVETVGGEDQRTVDRTFGQIVRGFHESA